MEITFPKYLEAILKRYLKTTFYDSTRRSVFSEREFSPADLKFFAEGSKKLSGLFTSERVDLPTNYLNDKKLRAGYLLYFLPLNFCKAQSVLQKLPLEFFHRPKLKILDMGCGPGTFTLALIDSLIQNARSKNTRFDLSVLSLDQNYHILKDATALHEEMIKNLKEKDYSFKTSFTARTFDLRRGKPDTLLKNDKYDLIVASNFLNEWSHSNIEEKSRFLEKIYQRHLAPNGYIVLIDPALQKSSRELMALRDRLISRDQLHVFSPCLHQKDCPMLAATDRDWCHFYLPWKAPDFVKQLDRLLKNKNDYLKCSYLILAPKQESEINRLPLKEEPSRVYRVISNLMGSKGKSEMVVCGPAGRYHVTRQDKNVSPKNKSFSKINRGDLVIIGKIPSRPFTTDGEVKIEKEDEVEKF